MLEVVVQQAYNRHKYEATVSRGLSYSITQGGRSSMPPRKTMSILSRFRRLSAGLTSRP
jgi:hypothetical protein